MTPNPPPTVAPPAARPARPIGRWRGQQLIAGLFVFLGVMLGLTVLLARTAIPAGSRAAEGARTLTVLCVILFVVGGGWLLVASAKARRARR